MSDQRTALVTGATSGIGEATAKAFAAAGYNVVLAGRREDKGKAVEAAIRGAGGEATFVQADVTDPASVDALVKRTVELYGGLHVAFNNAGVEGDAFVPTHESTLDNFDHVFNANVRGVFTSMKAELPAIMASGGGAIVNNASVAGIIGFGGMSTYTATKHAVAGFTRAAAVEYATLGVRINAVAPGPIETEMYDRFAGDEEVQQMINSIVPMGRPGSGAEVASAVLWLASADNSYTTGQVVAVDGGMIAQ